MTKPHRLKVCIILALCCPVVCFSNQVQELKTGDVRDGNRSIPVHLIDLYDEDGFVIRPGDEPMMPFSLRQTCQKCHNWEKIRTGWHFNAAAPEVPAGRRGEPWILVDEQTASQIPVSYRPWPGSFTPDQIGLTPWEFLQAFGRHSPGGGIGEMEESLSPEHYLRWMISGKLEINCLSCHDAEPEHDQAQYGVQISHQNFRWAAAATSGFATVAGSAKEMPDTYDIYSGFLLDEPDLIPPSVSYDKTRFDPAGKAFFDIVRRIPNERCYFCHSTKKIGRNESMKWHENEDVHLAARMACIDCHRNGIDHNMVRGYEEEFEDLDNPGISFLSCRGCHLHADSDGAPKAGRLGAPLARHDGLPSVHLEKLSCTACHSGPWPSSKTVSVKTSRAHALGTYNVNKSNLARPHIYSPVFIKQENGKIAPHRLFWPAFWGIVNGENVTPVALGKIKAIANFDRVSDSTAADHWPELTPDIIVRTLSAMTVSVAIKGTPVYASGGRLYRLSDSEQLTSEEHPDAGPYYWPLAHDVRPAAQSLGIRGCKDCHDIGAPFYFSTVAVDSPLETSQPSSRQMIEFQDLDEAYVKAFALSFLFRPWLKLLIVASTVTVCVVLVHYGFKGLDNLLRTLSGKNGPTKR